MEVPLSKKQKIQILNTTDLYQIMQQVLLREDKIGQNREHFWVVGLGVDAHIIFVELISFGSQRATIVEPMEVFSLALQKRAANVILCHNHPSGNLTPSAQDRDITDRLIQVGFIVNTPVLDHHIIDTKSFLSFEQIDLMRELRKSVKYVPSFELAKRIRAEAEEIMQKRAEEEAVLRQEIEQKLAEERRLKTAAKRQATKAQKAKEAAEKKAAAIEKEALHKIKQEQEKTEAAKKEAEAAQQQLQAQNSKIAKAMKIQGLALEVIVKVTGLSLEEVEGL